ncbi:esterase/lipase family protein [Corynebacterium resistens]|uniref:esterase/lipase family protein n=1 Tax=Corynebacterium resistens TaxID=258224 RepID=UPI0023548651|nr:alpha/beta fold hydrolase [Corynebacterium resistens]
MTKSRTVRSMVAVIASGLTVLLGAGSVASAQKTAPSTETSQVTTSSTGLGSSYFDATRTTIGTGRGATTFVDAFMQTLVRPRIAPVGANDWTCKPTAEHPNPVILIHGTWENAYDNWSGLAPQLKKDGFCVFAPNLGRAELWNKGGLGSLLPNTFGVAPIEQSADQLGQVVDAVLRSTGARQVDLVGHSQGGVMARYYTKFGGGADSAQPQRNKVRRIITLGATNHGTTLGGMVKEKKSIDALGSAAEQDSATAQAVPQETSASGETPRSDGGATSSSAADRAELRQWFGGAAGAQQERGSEFIRKLNEGGETLPGIDYTIIATKYDGISTPYEATFLRAGEGATVRNITMQDGCEEDRSDHMTMSYSPRSVDIVRNALDPQLVPKDKIRCEAQGNVWGSR